MTNKRGQIFQRNIRQLTFFFVAILEAVQRGLDLSFSRWRRCYKSLGSFPLYLASEVQKRSNASVPSQKSMTKVSKSRAISPYVPGSTPGMAADKCITANVECNGTVLKEPKTEGAILFLNINSRSMMATSFWFTFNLAVHFRPKMHTLLNAHVTSE